MDKTFEQNTWKTVLYIIKKSWLSSLYISNIHIQSETATLERQASTTAYARYSVLVLMEQLQP